MLHIRAYKYWHVCCISCPNPQVLGQEELLGAGPFPVLSLAFQAAFLLTDVGPRL